MDNVWIEFIKQAPSAAALVFIVFLFLKHMKEQEVARADNAANMAKERRDHEMAINNMWAVNIKSMIEKQDQIFGAIAQSLATHEKASEDRYEKMKVTKDLIEAIKDKDKKKEPHT